MRVMIQRPGTENVELATITPEIASKWLAMNLENNRPIQEKRIKDYANDMQRGQWRIDGNTIKFNRDGRLIDGQHRLCACVQSGATFETYVIRGLELDAIQTIDRGMSRSNGQMLHMRYGVPNANAVAAALAILWRHENGILRDRSHALSGPEAERMIHEHPGMADSVMAIALGKSIAPVSILAFCHYVFSEQDKQLADVFFAKLCTGTDMVTGEPVALLRQRLIASKLTPRNKLGWSETLAIFIKAWNLTKQKRSVKILRWNEDEDFPVI